ncbi:MAG: sugar ABC transporter substrate-binding protein [OCS116 cluster bacterium]|nr:sugar ABC transporter substrate-binding protein [OCS116 cluster bacterium]
MKISNKLIFSASLLLSTAISGTALAAVCEQDVRVLAQPRESLTMLEDYKDEFEAKYGASFSIDYLNENDRRAKSRAEASTVGRYNVYYIDEANVALFAEKGWVKPLLDYYPAEYDFDDFDPGRKKVGSYKGKTYFAPIQGGGDFLYYRKDILEAAGVEVPTTLEELKAAVKKLHDPDNGIYGIALRGQRGSGSNVWRWMTYFKGFGGEWYDGDKPVFNSAAAIKATETYLELFKYSPPGTKTGGWTEVTEAFNSGQVALIIESSPLAGQTEDASKSVVAGKVGYAPPPSPLTGGGYGHGLAIGAKANSDEASAKCAGTFIAWATSKEQEIKRVEKGIFGDINRLSVFASDEFAAKYGDTIAKALDATAPKTAINFWPHADWPDLGDYWGIILEELIVGTRTDIQEALNELEEHANKLAAKRK